MYADVIIIAMKHGNIINSQGFLPKIFGNKAFIKQLLKLFVPAALQSLIAVAVLYVDNFALATLIKDPMQANWAKDALGLASPVINVVVMITLGWLGGTGIMISQYYGNRESEKIRNALSFRIMSTLALQIPFILLLSIIPGELITLSSNVSSGTTWEYAKIYLFFTAFTYIPFSIAYTLSFSLQETKRPFFSFLAALGGMATNIILDPIVIIFAPSVEDAIMFVALSTGIARIVQIIIILIYIIVKKDQYLFFFKSWHIAWVDMKKIVSHSFTVLINDTVFAIANMMLIICMLSFNPKIHDATTNLILILQFTTVIWPGMSSASAILIGSELGAGNTENAKKHANQLLSWGFAISFMLGTILFIVATFINPILSPSATPDMNLLSRNLQWVMAPIIISQGIFSITYYAIRSGGSRIVLFIDGAVMIAWSAMMSAITFSGAAEKWDPLLYVLLLESNQIVRMLLGLVAYKYSKWVRILTKSEVSALSDLGEQVPSSFVAGV